MYTLYVKSWNPLVMSNPKSGIVLADRQELLRVYQLFLYSLLLVSTNKSSVSRKDLAMLHDWSIHGWHNLHTMMCNYVILIGQRHHRRPCDLLP